MKKILFYLCMIPLTPILCSDHTKLSPKKFEELLLSSITIEQGLGQNNTSYATQQAYESLHSAAMIMAKALDNASEQEENNLRDILEKHRYYPFALANAEKCLNETKHQEDAPMLNVELSESKKKEKKTSTSSMITEEKHCQLCTLQ